MSWTLASGFAMSFIAHFATDGSSPVLDFRTAIGRQVERKPEARAKWKFQRLLPSTCRRNIRECYRRRVAEPNFLHDGERVFFGGGTPPRSTRAIEDAAELMRAKGPK